DTLIDITSRIGPGTPLFQDPGGEPGGRVVQRVSERLGLCGLDCLVTIFRVPKCLIALEIGSLRRGQWPRPWPSVRSYLQITEVDTNHRPGICQCHERRNPSPEISALSPVALVAETTHEPMPQVGNVLIVHAHSSGSFGESVTRQGRDDNVKRGTVDPVGAWIGQEWQKRKKLDERARPPMGQDQRNTVPVSGRLMDEVDTDAVEVGAKLVDH